MLKAIPASLADYDFVRKEMLLAARQKHLGFPVRKPEQVHYLEENIRLAITQHRFQSGLRVFPILFMNNHSRVGMVMMSEISPGKGGNELHLIFVSHKHRAKGYGSQILDYVLEQRQNEDIFARCSNASQKMYEMLERRGFDYLFTMKDGMRVLLRPKQSLLIA